jgi:8-oxo-dGTP pyrophosphatase MutT (NUDIX family)
MEIKTVNHGDPEVKLPGIARQVAVRVLLFNSQDELLLQRVSIPGKPLFFITPGGRMNGEAEGLLDAVRREITEETGFEKFKILGDAPVFSGQHVMQKNGGPVAMTEHFFIAKLLEDSDVIDAGKQSLTDEERQVFVEQSWFSPSDIRSQRLVVVPINLVEFAECVIAGTPPPRIDFTDPPEFTQ